MRRKAKVRKKLESLSVKDGLRAIRFAQVVVLVLDGSLAEADPDDGNILEKQDLAIARQVTDEGRALIIAINKWDLVGDRKKALRRSENGSKNPCPRCATCRWWLFRR